MERTARRLLRTLEDMDRELAALKESRPFELMLCMLDYGTPDFVPPLIDAFLKTEPNVLIRTREVLPGEGIPDPIPAGYISYPGNGTLPAPGRRLLALSRRLLKDGIGFRTGSGSV